MFFEGFGIQGDIGTMTSEIIKAIVGLAERFGFAALVAGYFMFRDYRMSLRMAIALEEIGKNLAVIRDRLGEGS